MKKRAALTDRAYWLQYELDSYDVERKIMIDQLNIMDKEAGVTRRELDAVEEELQWFDFLHFCNTGRFPDETDDYFDKDDALCSAIDPWDDIFMNPKRHRCKPFYQ